MAIDDTNSGGARRGAYEDNRYEAENVRVGRAEAVALSQPGLLRRISWGAVLAGAVMAVAIQFLLGLLGVWLGGMVLDPTDPAGIGDWGLGSAIYTFFSQIVSLIVGGFVAARLAGIPKETTSLIHGAMVWAVVSLATLWAATTAAGSMIGGATSALSALGRGGSEVVETVVPDDLGNLPTPQIEMEMLPPQVRQALRENDLTTEDLQEEIRGIYRDVVSQQEERRISRIAGRTVRDVAASPDEALSEIESAIDRIIGEGAVLSNEERQELLDSLQQRLDLSNEEVDQLVTEVETAAQEAAQNVEDAIETVETEAAEAAEEAADTISSIALTLFIASILGLLAAVGGGIAGKPEHGLVRDERSIR
ncbi:hypothetical protein [Parvularcula oceani]|uniref:hypothetical protein n=1 Tax=Parvularcula oceani TaxID=1247963 RepID=UPI0004E1120C|nr:hypothetical protein [Parvularcula oceani]